MILIPYYKCKKRETHGDRKCKRRAARHFGISKKSKFANDVDKFKNALLTPEQYARFYDTKYNNEDDHDWDGEDPCRVILNGVVRMRCRQKEDRKKEELRKKENKKTVKIPSKEEVKINEFDLLKTVYFAYIASKHCVEVRKDYPHYLDKDTFNSRKKITKVWEDYIESKYSDVDKDKLWDEANKMWNRWSQKPLIRSTYSKKGEAECGSLGLAYIFIYSKKYKHLLPLIEDKVKKDF
jgi:hypothetical protein